VVVATRQVRTLHLQVAPKTPAMGHISAASGMVVIGNWLYVVADDELHLGVFDLASPNAGRLVRLLEGVLPDGHAERKAAKPDFEVLVRLPAFPAHPHGALLALGSGSRPNRRSAACLPLDASGRIAGKPRAVDLSPFYVPLEGTFPDLNIEGAVVVEDQLVLLQRGGKSRPPGGLAYFPLSRFFDAINADGPIAGGTVPSQVSHVDLGTIEGAALAFTDGAALPDGRVVFTAVAENTLDSYLDGPCLAAVVGILDRHGHVQSMQRLEPTAKVEGVHAVLAQDHLDLMLVTDADDAAIPAKLLTVQIPLR